jgi:hypothetical protein
MTALNTAQAGQIAATNGTVEVFVDHSSVAPTASMAGPLSLERFGLLNLFRLVVNNETMDRNVHVFCLPPDCMWHVEKPKKIKSRRLGLKAIEIDICLPLGHKEGYDRLRITAPYDGEAGSSMLFAAALVWANQDVVGCLVEALRGSAVK